MAAKLKKRALAEYGSKLATEERREPTKRLRLTARSTSSGETEPDPVLNIDANTSERRIVLELMKFGRHLNLSSSDNLQTSIRRIDESLKKLKDSSVKVKLILIYAQILASGKLGDLTERISDIVENISSETSSKLISAWLQAATIIVQKMKLDVGCREQLVGAGRGSLLGSGNPVVHINGLNLLANLVQPDTPQVNSQVSKLVGNYSMSQDARVRTAAFASLRTIHSQGVALEVSLYPVLCSALRDDYEGVRCEVLRIMAILAESQPEYQIKIDNDSGCNRLVDDVFSRICQVMNDVREPVRCLAAQIIGTMSAVSQTFLEQTLDKKLMSNMRMKKSSHERQAGLISSGEWSSGKKWADDAPKEKVESNSVNLVSLGSCGAFVHGLEDECFSVRVAAINSLTTLAMENHSLAVLALDFLVDMFNDEIEQVRLKAIESLTTIAKHIKLQVTQLDIILGALDDFSTLLREKLHGMLQACTVDTKDGLKSVINKLMANLKKYPHDRRSILVTFKHLGSNHPDLTLPLVISLLDIHPFFDTPEPDIEDPGYLCTLVLVLNAAHHCPTLPPLLDDHTKRHHAYLQDTFPHLIPSSSTSLNTNNNKPEVDLTKTAEFLSSVLNRVARATRMSSTSQLSVLEASCRELQRIGNIQTSINDPASFARMYIEAQILYEKIVRGYAWAHNSSQTGRVLRDSIQKLQVLSKKLNSMFSDLNKENQLLIRVLKLKVLGVNLVSIVSNSNKSAKTETDEFLREFESVLADIPADVLCNHPALVEFDNLNLMEAKSGLIVSKLKPLLLKYPPACLRTVSLETKQARAVMHEPTPGSENPLKCLAGLVLGIHLDAEIFNVPDPASLRICLLTADQVTHLSVPKRGDLVQTPQGFRLLTSALLSHQVWSEQLDVEVCVVLDLGSGGTKVGENLVQLCKPVKVSVFPKQIRRGI